MAFLEALFGAPQEDPRTAAQDDLAKPDPNEATDLGLHVRQCAKRYGVLADGQTRQDRKIAAIQRGISRTQLLLLFVILLLLLNKSIALGDLIKLF